LAVHGFAFIHASLAAGGFDSNQKRPNSAHFGIDSRRHFANIRENRETIEQL
jgi:hypothetical protein